MPRTRGIRRTQRATRPTPTPPPRTAPIVVATALVGALGCGSMQDRPQPPQVVPPETPPQPYYEAPQMPAGDVDAGTPVAPPPQQAGPPQPVPPEQPVPPQKPVPPQPRPPQVAPVLPDQRLAPPPLVGPFDALE